jgi:predicted RNA binding protein YcfA (HicA-like mRNA interferase family)
MSRHLPALKPRAILRALNKAGFFVHHVSGSHYILTSIRSIPGCV